MAVPKQKQKKRKNTQNSKESLEKIVEEFGEKVVNRNARDYSFYCNIAQTMALLPLLDSWVQ